MSSKPTANKNNDTEPWQWGDSTWQNLVKKVRAGKSLKPKRWKNKPKLIPKTMGNLFQNQCPEKVVKTTKNH